VKQGAPEGELTPVELPVLDLEAIAPDGRLADPDSLVLLRRKGDVSEPVIFDPARDGWEASAIPYRFEPDYEGRALPLRTRRGKLVFLAPSQPGLYQYHLYFTPQDDGEAKALSYHGAIGDGDPLVQVEGLLTVDGYAEPTAYGRRIFGRKGLLVGASYGPVRFFEDVAPEGSRPELLEWGALKDRNGADIAGTPQLVDWDGDGTLSLVAGHANDAKLYLYRNLGTSDDPIFAPREPLRHADGSDIWLVDYLRDITVPCIRSDGTPNPIYPRFKLVRVHGGHVHLSACAQFVDLDGNGSQDLLLATRGGFVLYFRREDDRFARGEFLCDEAGEVARPGAFIQLVNWRRDGLPSLLAGRRLGFVDWWDIARLEDGVPVLRNRGPVRANGEPLRELVEAYPLLVDWGDDRGQGMVVGNHHGHLVHYPVIGSDDGVPSLAAGEPLRTRHAKIMCNMAACSYADLDGDGKRDLVAGGIPGEVDYYHNLGTNRNPVFAARHQLRDEDGPIKLHGGPDPTYPEDGYSKPTPCDLTGDGRTDFVVGTGLGRVYYFRNLGTDPHDRPTFARGRVLRDTKGHEIMSHHMSSVEVGDWDGDGLPDLLVGGQPDVHGLKDDDPDPHTRVRFYRGVSRDADGMVQFAPYVSFEAEGDREIGHRPKPRIGVWQGEEVLYCHNMIFRKKPGAQPEQLEFLAPFPPMRKQARRSIISADVTFSQLGPNDPAVVQASCERYVYLFRRSFVLNRGYLSAAFHIQTVESRDSAWQQTLNARIDESSHRISAPRRDAPRKTHEAPRVAEGTLTTPESPAWDSIPSRDDVTTRSLMLGVGPPPPERRVSVQFAWDPSHLYIRVRCNEPRMTHLIDRAAYDNAYSILTDDHVFILVAPDQNPELAHAWTISSLGFKRESFLRRDTGQAVGRPPDLAATPPARAQAVRDASPWMAQLTIPFGRFSLVPSPGDTWSVNIRRNRSLYADDTRAAEQREAEIIDWSGAGASVQGSVRLCLVP